MLFAAEDFARQRGQALFESRIVGDQFFVFELQLLDRGRLAFVLMVEIAQGFVVVVGGQQLLALDAERLGNPQRLVRDASVQRQERV